MGYNWLPLGLTFVLVQIFLNATDCRVVELDVDASEEKFEKLTPQDFRNGLHINISDIDPNSPDPVERWKEEKVQWLIKDNSIFELFIFFIRTVRCSTFLSCETTSLLATLRETHGQVRSLTHFFLPTINFRLPSMSGL